MGDIENEHFQNGNFPQWFGMMKIHFSEVLIFDDAGEMGKWKAYNWKVEMFPVPEKLKKYVCHSW